MDLAWTTWKPLNCQCIFYFRSAWSRWPSQLCRCQGCCTRIEQDYCEGMGTFWCSGQHGCIRINPYPVRISSTSPFYVYLYLLQSFSFQSWGHHRYWGQKNCSWCLRSATPRHYYATTRLSSHSSGTRWYSRRRCFVCSFVCLLPPYNLKKNATDFQYISTAWPHLLLRISPGILWKLQVVLASKKKRTLYQSYVCTTLLTFLIPTVERASI